MTQFAPVAPLRGLYELGRSGVIGRYQLVIAPMVLDASWAYARFFWQQEPGQFVILDNGVIEQGYPMSPRELAQAAVTCKANVVILPDTIDDSKYTAKQVRAAQVAFRSYDKQTDTMGVVQGLTQEECIECAESHVEAEVDWLAVPRGLTANLGSRVELVKLLAARYGKPIHLLGFSGNIADDMTAATAHPLVRGIDSATPVWTESFLPPEPPTAIEFSLSLGPRPKEFWQAPISDTASHNVVTVRRWLEGATIARIEREGLAVPMDRPTQI